MNERNAKELMVLYSLSGDDLKTITGFKPHFEKNKNALIATWYKWLESTPEFEEFFQDSNILKHAKKEQTKYWEEFFEGKVDDNYLSYRKKIGEIHARIGLPLEIYIAGF